MGASGNLELRCNIAIIWVYASKAWDVNVTTPADVLQPGLLSFFALRFGNRADRELFAAALDTFRLRRMRKQRHGLSRVAPRDGAVAAA